jgi:uncharacterized protein (DUF433 family)
LTQRILFDCSTFLPVKFVLPQFAEGRREYRILAVSLGCEYGLDMNGRISIHPKICHGQACIAGTRIPVHQIVRMFAHGDSIDGLLSAFPSLTREDILACLDYAASLAEEQVTPLDDVVVAK